MPWLSAPARHVVSRIAAFGLLTKEPQHFPYRIGAFRAGMAAFGGAATPAMPGTASPFPNVHHVIGIAPQSVGQPTLGVVENCVGGLHPPYDSVVSGLRVLFIRDMSVKCICRG